MRRDIQLRLKDCSWKRLSIKEYKMDIRKIYNDLGICNEVYDFGEQIIKDLKERFEKIDEVADFNQMKV